MRVAQICRSLLRMAGTERFILETSRELSRRKFETRIYTSYVNRRLFESSLNGVQVEQSAFSMIPLLHYYSDLAISKRLIDASSSWADMVILHRGHGLASYAWEKHDLPCFPFFHEDKYDESLYGALQPVVPIYTYPLRILESKSIRGIPLAFVNSRTLGSKIRKHTGVGNLVVIPLGVDAVRFCPKWADEGFILMAGRFHPTNNFELGFEAVRRTPYKIVVAGVYEKKFSRYFRRLQEFIGTSPQLGNRVQLLNPSEDELIGLLQNCSVFLSPRRYGYLGLAALEAMACGKPVIAHATEDGIEGSPPVVKCGDSIRDWQEAIVALMSDINSRQAIGMESREFIEKGHTWEKSVDLMLYSIKTKLR